MKVLDFIHKYLPDSVITTLEDMGNRFGLPYPYTVPSPGDIFDCMFYWDTYFTNVGLIADGQIQQAIYNTDNIRHMIRRFGYMPNSTKAHHLGQSQPPFYYRMVSDIFAVTHDLNWLESQYDSIAAEYDFWMTKRIAPNGLNYYGKTLEPDDEELERRFQYAKTRFQGLACQDREGKLATVRTVASLCESGWDCCYRFEFSGPDYNPVDLNALLYGLETSMADFSKLLGRGEHQLWFNRAADRKMRMDELLYSNEKGFYLDWNFRKLHHSPVVSAASLFPLFVGINHDPKAIMTALRDELLLPYGVTGTGKPCHSYSLQWEYPNVWAPLQYVAYIACCNAGYTELADSIAKRYLHLLDRSFEQTGNLWEKYNGLDGNVMDAEYNAPPMMGWTAGIYLAFSRNREYSSE